MVSCLAVRCCVPCVLIRSWKGTRARLRVSAAHAAPRAKRTVLQPSSSSSPAHVNLLVPFVFLVGKCFLRASSRVGGVHTNIHSEMWDSTCANLKPNTNTHTCTHTHTHTHRLASVRRRPRSRSRRPRIRNLGKLGCVHVSPTFAPVFASLHVTAD
jgi:hypothetical protein